MVWYAAHKHIGHMPASSVPVWGDKLFQPGEKDVEILGVAYKRGPENNIFMRMGYQIPRNFFR